MNIIKLGTFNVSSGEVVISDPCYELDTWCQAVKKAANGKWQAEVEIADGKVATLLFAFHSKEKASKYEYMKDELGVDSGQLRIFDKDFYRNDKIIIKDDFGTGKIILENEKFYSACCSHTLSNKLAGVLSSGAVSASGYGDGGYSGYVGFNKGGELVCLEVAFIE
jgi:hypothetical protein